MAPSHIANTVLPRLRASAGDVGWAARLVSKWQHVPVEDLWSPHHQLAHLLAVETENFQPRICRILSEERPVLVSWDTNAFNAGYQPEGDIEELATRFEVERTKTVALLEALSPDQWGRAGTWPDGDEVDLAWLAEKALWHSLDHVAQLLDIHGELARRQARA